jgi:hypothetical protein
VTCPPNTSTPSTVAPQDVRNPIPTWLVWLAACVVIAPLASCARYQVGNASLYPPDIHTVYVPIFESNSYRRSLGERLTEAVVKEIELKTPFKVVSTPDADSILTGKILSDTKRVLIETATDEPRELQAGMQIQVSWVDRKGGVVRSPQAVPVPQSIATVNQTANMIPEIGQSISTAQQQAIQRLAEQIVGLMESPW